MILVKLLWEVKSQVPASLSILLSARNCPPKSLTAADLSPFPSHSVPTWRVGSGRFWGRGCLRLSSSLELEFDGGTKDEFMPNRSLSAIPFCSALTNAAGICFIGRTLEWPFCRKF